MDRKWLACAGAACAFGLGVTLAGCGSGAHDGADASIAERCGSRGRPVTIARVVAAFRKHGITLDINVRDCEHPSLSSLDVTNGGPTGLKNNPSVTAREGTVQCRVRNRNYGRRVNVTKYSTDTETYLDALNVDCAVYPSDKRSEARQVRRVKRALEELVRTTP